jgi:hypothetical protein
MTEQARPIRCHWGRVTPEPCMEPATVEIVGPTPALLCEEHARQRLAEELPEGWEDAGPQSYARECEDAVSQLYRWEQESGWGILFMVLQEARTYLETYELRRAQEQLVLAGGTPRPTAVDLVMLDFYRKCAKEYGWTDSEAPRWVERLEGWQAKLRGTHENEGTRA